MGFSADNDSSDNLLKLVKPAFAIRNYETSKERCDRIEREVQSMQLTRIETNEKIRPKGLQLRKQIKSMEKQCWLRFKETDEGSRVQAAIAKDGNLSLKEDFNLLLFEQPVWKQVDKEKWRTAEGMSYRGQFAAHVANQKSKIFGASPRAEMSMICNNNDSPSKNIKSAWNLIKNEDDGGVNPYAGGF